MAGTPLRLIGHVDMDAFFAAIEVRDRPELRGKAVIVGGRPGEPRSVVSTASYEARRYGVHSAMPLATAYRLCPHGVFLPVDMARYAAVSHELFQILQEFTPVIEPVSIDEAFLDLSHAVRDFAQAEVLGRTIKETIRMRLRLTASLGLAPNKFLAKIASDLQKPDGLTLVRPQDVDDLLLHLPLERFWGLGVKSRERLEKVGISSVADLRPLSRAQLRALLGSWGEEVYDLIRGIDARPVAAPGPAKSVGREFTFPEDIRGDSRVRQELGRLSRLVAARLEDEHQAGRTVVLKARYADFTTHTRSRTLPRSLWQAADLYRVACDLVQKLPRPAGPFRLLGLSLAGLVPYRQLPLLCEKPSSSVAEAGTITTATDSAKATAQSQTGPQAELPAELQAELQTPADPNRLDNIDSLVSSINRKLEQAGEARGKGPFLSRGWPRKAGRS